MSLVSESVNNTPATNNGDATRRFSKLFYITAVWTTQTEEKTKTHPSGESAAESKRTVKAQLSKMDSSISIRV